MKRGISTFLAVLFCATILALYFVVNYYFVDKSNPTKSKDASISEIGPIIIPHFDAFKDKRREFLSNLSSEYKSEKIVLFSVNHFSVGTADLLVTDRKWDYKDLEIKIDDENVAKVASLDFVAKEENPFIFEHGIKNVLGDLAQYFPDAQITPIIVRDDIAEEDLEEIFDQVYSAVGDSMSVFSIDFSHYCPSSMAQIHDAYSISALRNLDKSASYKAETDSPQLMNMAVRWAQKTDKKHFNLFYNSNSGEIADNTEMETTSVVLGYYSNGSQQKDKTSTAIFAGDVMLDRLVYHAYRNRKLEEVFSKIGNRFFSGANLSMVNLEGPISKTQIDDNIAANNLVFNFPMQTPLALSYLNINAVSLANNHTNNAGHAGFENTVDVLNKAQISSIGSYDNRKDSISRVFDGPTPIALIATHELIGPSEIEEVIEEHSLQGRFVIVFPHWGSEYSKKHVAAQEEAARKWQKAGANLVIGSHPHVVEDFEIIDGTPVVYSLGNFVFDQNFSRETNEGLIVGAVISENNIKLSFFPVKISGQTPELMCGQRRAEILEGLLENVASTQKVNDDTIIINRN
ncbi:MAG: Capsule biosynthesis protein CapA [candidate division WS2 bacterium ADurb.Bin280]|uniref:Capsule biosynthesis protein CapA n=1 Tax=candidate division WS2 bacterium ADurb.Bin280 TaxID=1852829 RepID=A0A1V5SDG4_9BACT|nr:MAG: Capsule biosynthesis protein CapA [candidate division WS2 bacterium ADurb.Bin280]